MARNDLVYLERKSRREAKSEGWEQLARRYSDNATSPYRPSVSDTAGIGLLKQAWAKRIGEKRVEHVAIVATARASGSYALHMQYRGWGAWLQIKHPQHHYCRIVPAMKPVFYNSTEGDRVSQLREAVRWLKENLYVPTPYYQAVHCRITMEHDCWYAINWVYEQSDNIWGLQRWWNPRRHDSKWFPSSSVFWITELM